MQERIVKVDKVPFILQHPSTMIQVRRGYIFIDNFINCFNSHSLANCAEEDQYRRYQYNNSQGGSMYCGPEYDDPGNNFK